MADAIPPVRAGALLHFFTTLTVEPANTLADPTKLVFCYSIAGVTQTQLTYAPGGGVGAIIKDGVGLYHVDLDTTGKAGVWEVEWASQGAPQVTAEPITVTVVAPVFVPAF